MFRHILVPVDQHPSCEHAAQHAFDLCRALGGQVTLLYVLEGDRAADRRAAQAYLDALARSARRPPARVVLPVQHHDVVGAVSSFAQARGADLIVLGTRGSGGLEDAAQGALALSLARSSGRPVHLASGAGGTGPARRRSGPRQPGVSRFLLLPLQNGAPPVVTESGLSLAVRVPQRADGEQAGRLTTGGQGDRTPRPRGGGAEN